MTNRDWLFSLSSEFAEYFDDIELAWLKDFKKLFDVKDIANLNTREIMIKISNVIQSKDTIVANQIAKVLKNASYKTATDLAITLGKAIDDNVMAEILAKTNPIMEKIFDKAYRSYLQMRSTMLNKANDAVMKTFQLTQARYAGGEPLKISLDKALQQEAIKGFKFVDKAGRNWDARSYMEMNMRTTTSALARDTRQETLREYGQDLVIVTVLADGCDMCQPWEGQILSVSGNSTEYSSIADAENDGYHHPNCRHDENLYIEDVSTEPETYSAEETSEKSEQREKQRYLERQLREWNKRDAIAITPETKAKVAGKIKQWNDIMDKFLSDTGRTRR